MELTNNNYKCNKYEILFNINNIDDIPRAGMRISIIYYPDINTFNGIMSLQIIIKEWKETI